MNQKPSRTLLTSRRIAYRCLAALVGGTLALACVLGGRIAMSPKRPPVLVQEDFDSAVDRWQSVGPDSYRISVQVTGRQPATYETVVSNGAVRSSTRNGQPLKGGRTLGTWSVPGMFGTIEIDLENQARVGTEQLQLRAEFDPELGIPRKYERVEMRSYAHEPMTWKVIVFSDADSDSSPRTVVPSQE